MRIDLPDDLTSRLEQFIKAAGQDIDTFVREAIETRHGLEDHLATSLHDWPDDELRAAVQDGLDSGPPTLLDMDAIKRQARHQREQSRQG